MAKCNQSQTVTFKSVQCHPGQTPFPLKS